MAFLTRDDAARNLHRFYIVQVMPNLFGNSTVLREWGRRGSPGTVRLTNYRRQGDAEAAERRTIKRRLQHGYNLFNNCRDGPVGTALFSVNWAVA